MSFDAAIAPAGPEAQAVERGFLRVLPRPPVVTTRIGPRAARDAARSALALPNVRTLVIFGTCGALSPEIRAGDVVVYDRCLDADGTIARCDAGAVSMVLARLKSSRGVRLHARAVSGIMSPTVVTTVAAKHALRDRSGADVVDMESFAIVAAMHAAGVACVVVRAVSDAFNHELPALGSAIDDAGRLLPLRLALAMVRAPRAAVRLSLNAPRALQALERAACIVARG